MKRYRCVFSFASGHTTINIAAGGGEQAVEAAAIAITPGDYDSVEVWDGETLILARTTPRAWDALGDATPRDSGASGSEWQAAPLQVCLPRRAPSLVVGAGLRALGSGGAKSCAPKAAIRKK